jgi:ribulose-phosphate 3-epimerase
MAHREKTPLKISPSILSADYGHLAEESMKAERGGGDALHIDVMDGHYCHNFSFGTDVVPALKRVVKIPLVAHLEIGNPDEFIEDFAEAGSDLIVVQEDTCPHLPRTVYRIRKTGKAAGIAINPDRGFEKIEANPEVLSEIGLLIIMAAYPGFGGQPFSPAALPKLRKAREMRDRLDLRFDIGVDGHVNERTIPEIVIAGGNYLIGGSSVFNKKRTIEENIRALKDLAEKTLAAG